ncbi:class I SAM-dependent methyltransferase [Streptomyces alkaliterrae]|uniref:Class I SAM-dependent methyltransferase n=1 Tax=Streptomyces alkaliterrae TaxID=2213162 RepID=A0A5P0YN14_9ACTN|nr:class I SAM-dependent methyltransferase [Streptomyces alkaliterrae]MBB1253139.1 class I SAM-dependent methyltransferase [Streptomyces alkaliterrae]MBB1259356.1 class I SAM-dependent methyltransferase [Streptomyces alkaliterrae]MQS01733.1 methyltransferase domain-containing protein [Streptomyces alkaliterrae]
MPQTSHASLFWDRYKPDKIRDCPAPEVVGFEWTQYEGHGPGTELLGNPVTALELGPGEGREAAYLARRQGVHVTALDLSRVQVERARRWWAGEPGLDFVHGEACAYLAETELTFDVIYSIWGAVWFTDPEELFPLVFDRLRPGGAFVFSHGEVRGELYGRQPMYGKGPDGRGMTVDRWCYPPEVWADLLKRNGFAVVDATCLAAPVEGLGTLIVRAQREVEVSR